MLKLEAKASFHEKAEEQLALVANIATVLREAVRSEDEVAETAYLAESPTSSGSSSTV